MKKISRRTGLLVGIPLGLLLAGGIALAIVVLTTTVGGATGFNDTTASGRVASVSGTKNGPADCTDVKADSSTAITLNPRVSRTLVDGKTPEVNSGSCSVTIRIDNTGQVTLNSTTWSADKLPTGWQISQNGAYYQNIVIAPGATGTVTLTVTAGSDATAGVITGRLISST